MSQTICLHRHLGSKVITIDWSWQAMYDIDKPSACIRSNDA